MNIGRNEIGIGIVILLLAIGIGVVLAGREGSVGQLDHVLAQVDEIREAELDHHEAFGGYVGAEAAPRPPAAVDATAVPWEASDGFRRLSWAPDDADEVYASYAVALTGGGFRVTAVVDLDGDGAQALIEATHEAPASVTTPSGVY
ncbi:MAG TPA: hypothetical protein ENK18_21790 [Deltaproteobacteria bacterium]|nr:hypothetical protein [Deltaproteobacteria bacterium]